MPHVCECLWKPIEDFRSPGAGVTGSWRVVSCPEMGNGNQT